MNKVLLVRWDRPAHRGRREIRVSPAQQVRSEPPEHQVLMEPPERRDLPARPDLRDRKESRACLALKGRQATS